MTDKYFEEDEYGDPTDETLDVIRAWSYEDGFEKLMNFILPFVNQHGRLECRKFDTDGEVAVFEFATGGWSSNEYIINSLRYNYMFWASSWEMSTRGGYYEFHIPRTKNE